jgi:hypothetical protein
MKKQIVEVKKSSKKVVAAPAKKTTKKIEVKVVASEIPRTTGTGYHVRKVEKKGVEMFCITKEQKVGKGKNAELVENPVGKPFKGDNAMNQARIELRRILRAEA